VGSLNKGAAKSGLIASVVLVLGSYGLIGFTGSESLPCGGFSWIGGDQYNLLAEGLARGQLNLPVDPPPELLALDNPYDPVANEGLRLHDAVLYNGKYFSYFGITPALVFFLPLRLAGFVNAPTGFAVLLFGAVGFASAVMLLLFFLKQRGCTPGKGSLFLAVLALGFCNTELFLLRRPSFYEVAISCGYAFLLLGVYLLVTGIHSDRPSWWRLGTGSLCLALAVGGRPHLVFAGPLLAAVFLSVVSDCWAAGPRRVGWATLVVLGPYISYGLFLAAYNYLRFGSPTDFGWRYLLAGDEMTKCPRGIDLMPNGMYLHFCHLFKLDTGFPFIHFQSQLPVRLPEGLRFEVMCGALVDNPILWLFPVLPFVLAAGLRRSSAESGARTSSLTRLHAAILVMLPMTGLTLILVCAYLGLFTMRYQMDYGTLFLLPTLVAWFYCLEELQENRWRRPVLVVGTSLLVAGCAINVGLGLAAYDDGAQFRYYWIPRLIAVAGLGLVASLIGLLPYRAWVPTRAWREARDLRLPRGNDMPRECSDHTA